MRNPFPISLSFPDRHLLNIIGNAVKFTSRGGVEVKVSADVESERDKIYNFKVSVKDTGPGLSQEQRERLFQPFMQGDNSITRKFGGTGLGLVLSSRLAEALGGRIEIADFKVNHGCTFVISFHAEAEHAARKAVEVRSSSAVGQLKDIRILLVDDSPDNLYLAKRLLCRQGAHVETAFNGLEAIQMAKTESVDIVLMDIQMPVMDGYEAMNRLRSQGFEAPIIALTAHAMLEDRNKALEHGFNGHLTKPLNFSELIKTVVAHANVSARQV